ncbi:ankyrin repeat domain-containing protein 17-like [Haliotis rubra]|uniref:ankyrin repeat domain-containing protein 17-like n=1 Tax=Haliotis rubra TaxID=36100 RepID=UPI001EE53B75|nr:ankyrin repeat domain-containing protein 17-like [Haliotis rubra]
MTATTASAAATGTTSTTTSATTPVTSCEDGYLYVGCYLDDWDRMINDEFYWNTSMTHEWCLARCGQGNYLFAGLQNHLQCFCGNSYDDVKYTAQNEGDCDAPCRGNISQAALTSAVYFMVVLSTCSTKDCGLQLTEKMKSRSIVLRKLDMKVCQTECIEDSFIFASCRRSSEESKKTEKTSRTRDHPETHPSVLTESCVSAVCNETSQCVDEGCKKVCMEAPPLCDLHTASKTGDLSRVKLLLSQGQRDINCQEWIGRTPVMWASGRGHREVVELLASKGAIVSLVGRFGINILHTACLGGDEQVVKYVLSQTMLDINGRVGCGRTAVMLAAENGHKDVVKLLVEKGAVMSLVDETGDNVLHCACRGGDEKVVKYILSQEMVDINSRGHGKRTPVMVAGEKGHKEVVELLLHRACYDGRVDVVKDVLSLNSVDINSRGNKRRTPVMVAEERGHTEVVKLLVKHEANLSIKDDHGNNILHLASYGGRVDVLKYLLFLNSVDIDSRGWDGGRPVMAAGERGHKEVVELFVEHGANLLLHDRKGNNVLHHACNRGHLDVVKYVLSLNSLDINSRGWERRTPVMVAAESGHTDVVALLVKHGANLRVTDRLGDNILQRACYTGRFDVVKYVLSLNTVDVNSRGNRKRTPVMVAGERGHKDVVELLVKHGADLSLSETSRNKILHKACFRGQFDVVK